MLRACLLLTLLPTLRALLHLSILPQLTLNHLELDRGEVQAWGGATADDVLLQAALSAKWTNNDAIDKAVTAAVGGDAAVALKGHTVHRLIPFNPVDKKTVAEVRLGLAAGPGARRSRDLRGSG